MSVPCCAVQMSSVVRFVTDNQLSVGALTSALLQWSSTRRHHNETDTATSSDNETSSLLQFLLNTALFYSSVKWWLTVCGWVNRLSM